ncbi:MAG: amidase family protein [Rhodoblastus sp.]
MVHDWARFFTRFDLLLCPTAATTAFPHMQTGERWERMISVDGKDQPTTTQLFWAGYSNMVNLPSTIAPLGLAADGLPVGVQIVAPAYRDHQRDRIRAIAGGSIPGVYAAAGVRLTEDENHTGFSPGLSSFV